MDEIVIRQCRRDDYNEILNVCYKTGYMGEDLTNRNIFNDIRLFGLLFCFYYVKYEEENCFVAVDKSKNKIVGYIIGTLNSKKQLNTFFSKITWRVTFRVAFITLWKYPESFKMLLHFIRNIDSKNEPKDLYRSYPAHLHINILKEYQRLGLGGKLISTFENHVRGKGVKGIHLRTTSKNFKAVPFYETRGFKKIYEEKSCLWKEAGIYDNIIFVKEL